MINCIRKVVLTLTLSLVLPAGAALADPDYGDLVQQVEQLQEQLQQVQKALEAYKQRDQEKEVVRAAAIAQLQRDVDQAAEWKAPNSLFHFAGYADVGYTDSELSDGSFFLGSFSPIFHIQYRDKVLLESELEIEIEPDGETDVALEYLTIDWFLSDYVTLVGGKFLSPIGQFRQNLHPSWINKLPSAPPGFGHDGAAPVSEMGVQLRGGFPIGSAMANYAVYVGNGPELISVVEDDEFELDGVDAEAFGADRDGEKVFGGRFAVLPVPSLELGLSAATGKATVTSVEEEHEDKGAIGETARDYDVVGADFAWASGGLGIRGEYVRTKVGAATTGLTASPGATWKTWYAQGAYRFLSTKWEVVARYTDFDSPHAREDQEQWALGLNYLITNSVLVKGAYEFNDGEEGSLVNEDRWMLQLAYGF